MTSQRVVVALVACIIVLVGSTVTQVAATSKKPSSTSLIPRSYHRRAGHKFAKNVNATDVVAHSNFTTPLNRTDFNVKRSDGVVVAGNTTATMPSTNTHPLGVRPSDGRHIHAAIDNLPRPQPKIDGYRPTEEAQVAHKSLAQLPSVMSKEKPKLVEDLSKYMGLDVWTVPGRPDCLNVNGVTHCHNKAVPTSKENCVVLQNKEYCFQSCPFSDSRVSLPYELKLVPPAPPAPAPSDDSDNDWVPVLTTEKDGSRAVKFVRPH
eukprot:GFYU01007309.1.p1 GENE.GFYU01007309.1~~GFYU01007309.1.p1  ORF type:complete len:304 (+),score=50.84 GFYU01007309.1:125-913(+)